MFVVMSSRKNLNEILLTTPDASEYSPTNTVLNEFGNSSFVMFRQTDVKKDAAQSTIPYFDIQDVDTMSPIEPISGIGVYYKGNTGFGGYLGLRIHTLDRSNILNSSTISEYSQQMNKVLKTLRDAYHKLNKVYMIVKTTKC